MRVVMGGCDGGDGGENSSSFNHSTFSYCE